MFVFFFQAEDGIRDSSVTGVQTCALPISLHILFEFFGLRIHDENNAIRAVQHSQAGALVENLARHCIEMKPGSETMNFSQVQGKEVEKQRALSFGRDAQHLSTGGRGDTPEHVLQVCSLPTISNTVVNDLTVYIVGSNIAKRHQQDTPNG